MADKGVQEFEEFKEFEKARRTEEYVRTPRASSLLDSGS